MDTAGILAELRLLPDDEMEAYQNGEDIYFDEEEKENGSWN